MIILQEIGTPQTFSFIPRSGTYNTLTITDEQTNVTSSVTIINSISASYYERIQAIFSLKQNHFYTLTVKQNSTVVYKDRVFCTNQSIASYSVNNNTYTEKTSTNDFIIYE